MINEFDSDLEQQQKEVGVPKTLVEIKNKKKR